MSKTRDTGYLANVIQVHDTGVRIMSGSEMLMAISSSGAVTITGELSGSDAANSLLLNGTGSVGFTTTGSFSTASGSASSRLTQIEAVYATTGSNSFRATQSITGSLTVTGQIIAQTLNVQQVTSSIIYSSGSNVFGCDINSRQTFTGSFYQTGSSANFSGVIYGGSDIVLCGANGNVYGGTIAGSGTISNYNGSSYARFFGACHPTTPNTTAFVNGNSTTLTLNANNSATFAGAVSISCGIIAGSSICTQGTCTFVRAHNYTWMGGSGGDYGSIGYNVGYTAVSNTYTYAVTDLASILRFDAGGFTFLTAPGGTAGNPLSFAGKLSIANTGPATFACSICLAGGNIFLPGAIAGRGALIEMTNSQTADILGMPNLSSTFYLSYSCNSITFRNDSGGGQTILQMYCNRQVCAGGNFYAAGGITAGGAVVASSILSSTSQNLINSEGGFAKMVHKVQGAAGSFSQSVICVNLKGAGGYGYIINSGGTGGGYFQSGGGYTNGQGNFSHSSPVGSGYTVTCHACSGTDNIIRFVGVGGVHPFLSIQMFGSLQQDFGDSDIYIAYS